MSENECDHLLTYTTEMSGLNGLYIRCRDCLEYWSLEEAYASFAQRYVLSIPACPGCGCDMHSGWCDCGCLDNRRHWQHQMWQDMDRIASSGEDLSQEPDDWGFGPDGGVVDLR